ncbi:MAG: VWA domain-containing protein, partial [Chloroflexi bacterium]|nr:VWA domain-containing protein [Chloroflexota bacterium]
PNFGIVTTKYNPPLPTPSGGQEHRSLIGVVKINQLIPLEDVDLSQIPVDVVHVLDISGSMNYKFGSPATVKLTAAKQALITFNNILSPTIGGGTDGDRVGLATFPRTTSGSQYSYNCQQKGKWSTYLWGQNRKNLTGNISSVNSTINSLSANSGTPIAGGLLVGRQMVTDPTYHNPAHVPVIILASDGIANVRTNGQWTGFSGNTYNNLTCNSPAVQDAITEANNAKSDNNGDGKPDAIVFSIAIGTDFNPDALQAIASEPVDSHFYTASDAASMQSIYDQISDVIASETCMVNQKEIFAPNITVRVKNLDTGATLNTTATSTGYFAFNNIDAGTYEFQSISITINGLTYDIYTDGVGGPVLAQLPSIDVGTGSGTYEKNLSLKTDDLVCTTP